MSRRVVFLHAALAAIQPLARYCTEQAPELDIVNLLDDGLQRHFRGNNAEAVFARLNDLLQIGVEAYDAEAALVTCSAASLWVIDELAANAAIPVLKIDVPMAEAAVKLARKLGVLFTFPPTEKITIDILTEVAAREGRVIDMIPRLVPNALRILNEGNVAEHDRLMEKAAHSLKAQGAEALVLAQVSMAHLREPLQASLRVPVFESLSTSVAALRSALQ